jgi:flagellar P-ring protein precursor FlgI
MQKDALIAICLFLACVSSTTAQVRIKDITSVQGVRGNQLVGYGLVVGLSGTGDTLRNSPFTQQSISSMLDRMGVSIRNANPGTRNVAAVIVTAELPPFAARGTRVDVSVNSIGDATSLGGGTLVLTPLSSSNNLIYAVAQGAIAVGGLSAAGRNESVVQGTPTVGRIANGGIVEREAPGRLEGDHTLRFELHNPDFATAVRIAEAVNAFSMRVFGQRLAEEENSRTVAVVKPRGISSTRLIAEIGRLLTVPDQVARIVIDERTGTLVIGRDVKISTVAVAHGTITVRVTEEPTVSQPLPFSPGKTVVDSSTRVTIEEKGGSVNLLPDTNLEALVKGLNRMGLRPANIIAILQAIKSAGALQAELLVQ